MGGTCSPWGSKPPLHAGGDRPGCKGPSGLNWEHRAGAWEHPPCGIVTILEGCLHNWAAHRQSRLRWARSPRRGFSLQKGVVFRLLSIRQRHKDTSAVAFDETTGKALSSRQDRVPAAGQAAAMESS